MKKWCYINCLSDCIEEAGVQGIAIFVVINIPAGIADIILYYLNTTITIIKLLNDA